MIQDIGLDYLLELHGQTVSWDDGYWWKVEVWKVQVSRFMSHGIRYRLTLHDKYNTRVFGMDNAHAVKLPKKGKYSGRIVYDPIHPNPSDKGFPYDFVSAA